MDLSVHNLPTVFRELSRLSDGDHTIYLRADPHSFLEVHRAGIRNLFSTTVAAFIPDVVIKLQAPLASSIIAAVPSRQGSATLHTRSNLFIVENLSDTVNLVQHHKAAFIREDATLAVWANEVQPALVALRQVLRELGVSMDRHDLVRIVDPSNIDAEVIADSNTAHDAFDEFIHDYEDPADKSQDELALHRPGRDTLLPVRTLDDTDDLEAMYTVSRTNLFDSLSADSLALGDSPFLSSVVSSGMSRLCLNNTSHAPLSPTFPSLSFDFSSPSLSSDSSYDGSVLSTPLTVAPSVLSSPLSAWSSPQLPTILEEDALLGTLPVPSVDPSTVSPPVLGRVLAADTPSKRERSPKAKQAPSIDVAVPEKTRPRRVPRVPTPLKAAATTSPRARKTIPKAITPASPAPKRVVSPLPARSGRTRSSSISSTSSAASRTSAISAPKATAPKATAPKTTRSRAAQLTLPRVTHAACCGSHSELEHEFLESDDSGSEYEADPSELDLDELDDDDDAYDDYRPAKRTRSLPCSIRAASRASSITPTPVRRKAVSPKIASAKKKKAAPKKRRSSFGCASSKKKKPAAQPEGPPPTCVWCDRVFTRESDVDRHAEKSCRESPFGKKTVQCPLCDKPMSRNDAVLRHLGTDDCLSRQREQGLLPPEDEEAKTRTKTAASVRAAKKAAVAALLSKRRSGRSLSV
ncbi:hypothetical protein V8D89_015167 [Ganoderma adspersum]